MAIWIWFKLEPSLPVGSTKKVRAPEIVYPSPEDLERLFASDAFFTPKLLSEDLNISEAYKHLFFEYCSAQNIDTALIKQKKHL